MNKRFLKAAACAATAVGLLFGSVNTSYAAYSSVQKQYVVTYRPGDVGAFTDDVLELYTGYDAEVTKHGSVKITVADGEATPAAPTAQYVKVTGDYVVLPTSKWGPSEESKVTKNTDYVVDYGKIIDGVEYTVEYVDAATNESVKTPYIIKGNAGQEVSVTAPASLVISANTQFAIAGGASKTLILTEDAAENVITFKYNRVPNPVETVISTEYIEGDTVTNVVTVPGAPVAVPGVQTPQGVEEVALEEPTENAEQPLDETTIQEEQTPLDDSAIDNQAETEIKDHDVPLSPDGLSKINPLYVVAGTMAVAVLIAVTLLWLRSRKKEQTVAGDDTDKQ